MAGIVNEMPQLAEKYDLLSDGQYESGKALINCIGLKEGDIALDLGCGTGRLALYTTGIVGPAGKVLAIDPSPPRIEIAKRKLDENKHLNIDYRVASSNDLKDFEDNSINAAYLSAVLHWIPDKESTIKELYRVIVPGGKIGITTNDKERPFTIRLIINEILSQKPYAGYVDKTLDAEKVPDDRRTEASA